MTRLPSGAPGLGEYVFKYSVPDRFRIMTLPKASYLEALKEEAKVNSKFSRGAQGVAQHDGQRIVDFIKREADPVYVRGRKVDFPEVYRSPSDFREGHSLERATLLSYKHMQELSSQFNWSAIQAPPNLDVKKAVNFAYALHDSGRPIASTLKISPQEASAEIVTQVMNKGGFSKAEVDLSKALVGNDIIESMLNGHMSPHEAFEKLVDVSKQTNLGPKDYFKLQSLYFMADAPLHLGSSEAIQSEKFKVLENLFTNVELSP